MVCLFSTIAESLLVTDQVAENPLISSGGTHGNSIGHFKMSNYLHYALHKKDEFIWKSHLFLCACCMDVLLRADAMAAVSPFAGFVSILETCTKFSDSIAPGRVSISRDCCRRMCTTTYIHFQRVGARRKILASLEKKSRSRDNAKERQKWPAAQWAKWPLFDV